MRTTTLALVAAFCPVTLRSLVFALLLALALPTGSALAASYQQTNGTIVDPILYQCCVGLNGEHPYSGVDLAPGAVLQQGADLSSADLRDADLRGASLISANLDDAILSNADLRDAQLTNLRLRDADLSGANLSGSRSVFADLDGADLTGVVWVDSRINEMNLRGANLSFADLHGLYASEVHAGGASFAHANLDGSFLDIVLQDSDFTYASLRGARFDVVQTLAVATLSGANFFGADLTGASFDRLLIGGLFPVNISVSGTDFSNAVLQNVIGLGNTLGAALYDSQTDFTNAWADLDATIPFDPVAAGWTLVPEPGTAVLLGLGLVGLSARRRAAISEDLIDASAQEK